MVCRPGLGPSILPSGCWLTPTIFVPLGDAMKTISIDDILNVIKHGKKGTVREAGPDDEQDFVQERDKLAIGLGGRTKLGVWYCFDFDPPMMLHAGRGYVIELEDA